MRFSDIASISGGTLLGNDGEVSEFAIDTRVLNPGECFVAIVGETGDGHEYVLDAAAKGAVCVLVKKKQPLEISQIVVDDTEKALQALANHHRNQFSIPIMALTGSCGKTTVKEMVSSILPKPSLSTRGNYNNHIGVPLSLLRLNDSHRYAVFELGANHIGEIEHTVAMVKPNVAYICNIAPAHIEGFGSIEGVLKAKSEIFGGLEPGGTAVINIDDHRLAPLAQALPFNVLTCSVTATAADVRATNMTVKDNGCYQFVCHVKNESFEVNLRVPGEHNVTNALGACAMAYAVGISLDTIQQGLSRFSGVKGRLSELFSQSGIRIIDDTYNANVHSVKAAIDVLASYGGKRVMVLGKLAEAGEELSDHYHQIAEHLNERHIDELLTVGQLPADDFSPFTRSQKHFSSKQALADSIESQEPMTILVKGSRSARMEEVIDKLLTK